MRHATSLSAFLACPNTTAGHTGHHGAPRILVETGPKKPSERVEYTDVSQSHTLGARRFRVMDSGKLGYIDETGKIQVPLIYESGFHFSDGLAAVRIAHREWGFVDPSGTLVIPADFDYVRDFHDGYAVVEQNDKWGIINKRGEFTVKPTYERIGKMREGAASFTIAKKSGLMAANGTILVPPKYDHLSPPKDGWCIVKSKDRYLFIDTKGKVVFDPIKIGNIAWEFNEGVTPIRVQVRKARGKRKASYRWGYIDKKGKMIIKPKYVRAHRFSEGLASVETDMRMGFLFGYADAKGKLVIKPQWHHTEEFSEGLAVVKVGEKFGFIDRTGAIAIEAKYDSVTGFSNGLAHVELHSCADAHRSASGVCQQGRTDLLGYINPKGEYVWKPTPRR